MKLRTILSLLVAILAANTAIAASNTYNINVPAFVGTPSCTASVTPLSFIVPANVDFGNSSVTNNFTANSSITVTCNAGLPYSIALDHGLNYNANGQDFDNFVVDANGNGMGYILYSDANLSSEWSGQTVDEVGSGNAQPYTIYGAIYPGMNVGIPTVGIEYSDLVTASINF